MLITAFFTARGVPKTGLMPLINIWESDGSFAVDEQNMIERAGGFYDYDFVSYDKTEKYKIRADGGPSLSLGDRYKVNVNEIELGEVWDELTSDHVVAGSFGERMASMVGLMQENHYLDQTTYDVHGRLLSSRIRLYSIPGSVGTDSDVTATYLITAVWSGGELQTYKVVKQ